MNANNRSCGSCTACCFTHAVAEVNTKSGEWCKNCSKNGCSIYDARPAGCRLYECWWLKGKGDESDRPDLSGFVMDGLDIPGGHDLGIVNLWEVTDGALESNRARQIIQAVLDQNSVIGLYIPADKKLSLRFPTTMTIAEREEFVRAFREFDHKQ